MPGAVATELLVARVTVMPPDGAGALRNTVPVEVLPPGTLVGLRATDCKSGGAFGSEPRSIQKDLVTPPAVASIRTELCRNTRAVVILKLFALFPGAMETPGGTWASPGSLVLR